MFTTGGVYYGGSGADKFVYGIVDNMNDVYLSHDTIMDFSITEKDVLDFSSAYFYDSPSNIVDVDIDETNLQIAELDKDNDGTNDSSVITIIGLADWSITLDNVTGLGTVQELINDGHILI